MISNNKVPSQTRYFNSISYGEKNTLIKTSKNIGKINQEIFWYKHIPDNIKRLTAELLEWKQESGSASYTLRYYPLPNLAEVYTSNSKTVDSWKKIIDGIWDIIALFKTHKKSVPFAYYKYIYDQKTIDRLNKVNKNKEWHTLLTEEIIRINNVEYLNYFKFEAEIKAYITRLFNIEDNTIIHGDLCLSNILYDEKRSSFVLIDPRGSWKEDGISGDIKYDIAKLRHSMCSYYDFIMRDKFSLKEELPNVFKYKIHTSKTAEKVAKLFDMSITNRGYDVDHIKFIESQLFLSMIPLHKEDISQQKAMYLTGILLLNKVFNK